MIGCISLSGIARLKVTRILNFTNTIILLFRVVIPVYTSANTVRFTAALRSCPHLMLSDFLVFVNLVGALWYPILISIPSNSNCFHIRSILCLIYFVWNYLIHYLKQYVYLALAWARNCPRPWEGLEQYKIGTSW